MHVTPQYQRRARARIRDPWLIALLLGELLGAAVVAWSVTVQTLDIGDPAAAAIALMVAVDAAAAVVVFAASYCLIRGVRL